MHLICKGISIISSNDAQTGAKKSFKLVWRCHHLLSGFLANGHLLRMSRQSRLSANDKGDNEVIPGIVNRSPGYYLIAGEDPERLQLGNGR